MLVGLQKFFVDKYFPLGMEHLATTMIHQIFTYAPSHMFCGKIFKRIWKLFEEEFKDQCIKLSDRKRLFTV
jgi:hypothetical protein